MRRFGSAWRGGEVRRRSWKIPEKKLEELEEAGREGTGFVLSLLSSDEAEIDIVKEDLCGHVMPHVEGRVPPVCPGYWAGRLDDGFGWDVMASGRYSWQERSWFGMRILDVIGPCESALV